MTASWTVPPLTGGEHLGALNRALRALEPDVDRIWGWALALADVLQAGNRLLAVGNGGSAAQAQHLTSELVGRYCNDRHPFSAISLHADTSSVTAISNDYGVDAVFARQVLAHGRRGDVLIALSTSGHSPNVVTAAEVAMTAGLRVWALTGPGPNPLTECAHEALCIQAATTATVQEVHLVVVHLLCSFLDEIVGCGDAK
ncbi:MAG TPA: SIS domain-containing protein [Acidimicrobiales bacterium]|nr:SIS domain-containing protein [Acidimicrobiales bacterium]